MTDVQALKSYMDNTGMTFKAIAEKSGILRETLYNRLKSGDFKVSEICALSDAMNMTAEDRDRIFFAENSEYYSLIEGNITAQ